MKQIKDKKESENVSTVPIENLENCNKHQNNSVDIVPKVEKTLDEKEKLAKANKFLEDARIEYKRKLTNF